MNPAVTLSPVAVRDGSIAGGSRASTPGPLNATTLGLRALSVRIGRYARVELRRRRLDEPGDADGPVLENFVVMELARQLTWADVRARLYHDRTKDQLQVDAVIEAPTAAS